MKVFLSWIGIFLLIYGGLAFFTHTGMKADPTRVVVSFDDSFYMKDAWPKIASRLKPYTGQRYTEYFIISNKDRISRDWESELDLDRFTQTRLFLGEFPVDDLLNRQRYPELAQADLILVFTTREKAGALNPGHKTRIIPL